MALQYSERGVPLPDPKPRPRDWRRALRALGRLSRNTEDTSQVFEILRALNGECMSRTHRRMRRSAAGRRVLIRKPKLSPLLSDRAYLESLPEGSLGRAYLDFMTRGQITADGLMDASERAKQNEGISDNTDPELLYVGQRLIEMHDLWHVLTGYGRDDTGELANLWFSYGQFRQLGMGFIALMGTLAGPRELAFRKFMAKALLRGLRAKQLVAMPLEEMLALPLDEARAALGIAPPAIAHPDGILTGNRREHGIGRGTPIAA